jgi:hypothetical protein
MSVRLLVHLCGYDSDWDFAGGPALRSALALAPWAAGGGVLRLCIDGPAVWAPLVESLREMVAAIDQASGAAVIDARIEPGMTPEEAVALAFGLPGASAGEPATLVTSGVFDRQATVLILGSVDGASELFDYAETLHAAATRRARALPPQVIACGSSFVSSRPSLDFRCGWPGQKLLEPTPVGTELWPRYLHARLAWEAAGAPGRAEELERFLPQPLLHGDDDRLDSSLNAAALEMVSKLDRDVVDRTISWSRGVALGNRGRSGAPDELVREGCVWASPGTRAHRPSPWFARALLLDGRQVDEPHRRALRVAALCWPLARELLGACVRIEASARARVSPVCLDATGDGGQLEAEFEQGWGAARFYPPSSPLRPQSQADFASPGALKRSARAHSPELGRQVTRLQEVRNALAHGHNPGWAAVQTVDSLLSYFGG